MPIDASIPLQAQTPNIDGMGLLGKVMSFREQQQRMDLQKQAGDALTAERTAETAARQQEIATKQHVAAGQNALAEAIKTHIKPGDDGLPQVDHQAVAATLMQGGFPEQAEAWLKTQASTAESLDKLNATRRSAAQAGNEYLGDLAVTAKEHDYDPHVITAGVAQAAAQGLIPEARARDILAQFDADPSSAKGLIDQLITPGASERQTKRSKESAEARKTTAEAKNLETYGRATPPEGQKATFLLDGKSVEGAFVPSPTGGRYTYNNEDVTGRAKPVPTDASIARAAAASDVTELTPAGLDAAALNYAKTGVLPPLGNGDKVTRKKIINRAAEMMPGLDVASAKADYEANKGSLTGLQKQRDAIGAFESTALKNLDVFLEAAKKIPDTGAPIFNRPIRSLNEKLFGDADLAAYNTARRTVIPEFAKILANPGLSGQLSDSARKEVEDVVSGSATLKQTIAAVTVLKRDTENRRTSYDDQIAGIKARISKAEPAPPPAGDDPKEGQEGTVNGTPAVWKTVNGKKGWYAK